MKCFLIEKFFKKDIAFFLFFFIGVGFFISIVLGSFNTASAFSLDIKAYEKDYNGYEITVNDSCYLEDLKSKNVFLYTMDLKGLTYDTTVQCRDSLTELTSFRRGMIILHFGKRSGIPVRLASGELWISKDLKAQLQCETGDVVSIGEKDYRVVADYDRGMLEDFFNDAPYFIVNSAEETDSSFQALFFDLNELYEFSKRVKNISDYKDEDGLINYYKGMKFLGGTLYGFSSFVALLCFLYYAVTISVFFMKKKESEEIFRVFGGLRRNYAFSVATAFSGVVLLGSCYGLLMMFGLRKIIANLGAEILGITLKFGSVLVPFGVFVGVSVVFVCVFSLLFSRRFCRDGSVFC